jgi:hypothetical protein
VVVVEDMLESGVKLVPDARVADSGMFIARTALVIMTMINTAN